MERTGALPEPALKRPRRWFIAALASIVASCSVAPSAPAPASAPTSSITIFTSGGFTAALSALAPQYSARTGTMTSVAYGPSMGATPNAIPNRLARGEAADVVILARSGLDRLAANGQVVPDSIVDLGASRIAVAVRDGAAVPDISTPAKLREALLKAKSVAWSDSASGVYIETTMLKRLGVADEVLAKGKMIPATPVGEIVAHGDAEIGFQQLSELKPVKGIRIVGLLPEELQQVTIFSGGVVAASSQQDKARDLLVFLGSAEAALAIRLSGLEPITRRKQP